MGGLGRADPKCYVSLGEMKGTDPIGAEIHGKDSTLADSLLKTPSVQKRCNHSPRHRGVRHPALHLGTAECAIFLPSSKRLRFGVGDRRSPRVRSETHQAARSVALTMVGFDGWSFSLNVDVFHEKSTRLFLSDNSLRLRRLRFSFAPRRLPSCHTNPYRVFLHDSGQYPNIGEIWQLIGDIGG